MKVLATPRFFILIFDSLYDLSNTIENLENMFESMRHSDVDAPFLYACVDEESNMSYEEINEYLDEIKIKSWG
jgi:hypothetical protein